ncbi:phosphatase PAP2 family protein [Neorhizobium sp. NPDC001467]|uniref:phosphatase PAP2 family protein n=1 Tax=Neorhizobium sp. NPDC001467 TaxID=3390595 RepID=UPI003CFE5085
MTALSVSRRPTSAWITGARGWFLVLATLWFCLLAVFHAFPQIDVLTADAFFEQSACLADSQAGRTCGQFFAANETVLRAARRALFYMPVFFAVVLIVVLVRNLQHHGATYCTLRTRRCVIALIALFTGPYLLVNLILKSVSGRPRPYETDLFGGDKLFTAAGSFDGSCYNNCSFVSGEAAGAGWVACLIVLVPARYRPYVAPPLILAMLASPILRISFGGHYLSDAMLGFLSSAVVYAGITAYFEMTQAEKKRGHSTDL